MSDTTDIIVYGFDGDMPEGTSRITAALSVIRDVTTLTNGEPASIRACREAVTGMTANGYPIGFSGVPNNAVPLVMRAIRKAGMTTVPPVKPYPSWF